MSTKPPPSEVVRSIIQEGAKYMEELLEENERLRLALAKERDADRATAATELTRLRHQLSLAQEDARSLQQQLDALRTELNRAESAKREFAESCTLMQEKQAALSSLYAASFELHASLDLPSVLASLKEIIINLLGSESFGIYVADDKQPVLRICVESGLPTLAPRLLEFGHGPIGSSVYSDTPWIEAAQPGENEPLVIIPLKVHERVVGTLAIFAFLKQKKGITDLDRELFRLLSAQAATALHGATLYSKEARRAATFEGLIDLVRSGVGKT